MNDRKKETLRSWISFLGVIYRLAIVLGLLSTVGMLVVMILINFFSLWVLIFPLTLVLFGVALARIEYSLYRKLKSL